MSFNHHIEFIKEVVDVHPQSGETKSNVIIDAYFYDQEVIVWGWGTFDSFKFKEAADAVSKVRKCLLDDGFRVLYEQANNVECIVCHKLHKAIVTSVNDIYVCEACEASEKGYM